MQLKVTLNGTDKNPFHQWGLKQNPFPQIARAELVQAMNQLNSLAGNPIQDTNDIRKRLEGWSQEFVDLCCSKFAKGKKIQFMVQFPYEGD